MAVRKKSKPAPKSKRSLKRPTKSRPPKPARPRRPKPRGEEKPAVVNVTDIVFRNIFTAPGEGVEARGCGHKLQMAAPNPVVSIDNDGNVVVKGEPVTIRFQFSDPNYFPAGIAFVMLLKGDEGDVSASVRLGHTNFPQADIHLEDHAVTIHDNYDASSVGYRFKFSIIIQDAGGDMGIIDPDLIHEPPGWEKPL